MMRVILLFLFLFSVCAIGQDAPDVVLTTGHNDQINAMAITPNGRFLASASNDKQVKIWEIGSGMEFRTISGTAGRIEQLAFSPNNNYLAGTSSNDEFFIWDIVGGEIIYKGAAGRGRGLIFSSDGKRVFFISPDAEISTLDVQSKTVVRFGDMYTADFLPDPIQELLYILDNLGNVHQVDMNSGNVLNTFKLFDEYIYPFSNSAISDDGKYIAYGFNDDKFRIFNTQTGTFDFISKNYESKIISLAMDKSKPIVYIALHNGEIILFNYKTKKVIEDVRLKDTLFRTQCMTTHPDGEIVLLANNDRITYFDFKRKRVFNHLDARVDRIYNMAYDPTGRYLAVATDKLQLKIWDLRLNKVVDSIPAFFPCIFTPDGQNIIAMTNQIKLGMFNVETSELEKSFETGYELIQSVAVSDDGTKLAGAGFQNKVKVWEISSANQIAEMAGHTAGILALDFHPTKPWVVSGSIDQTARVWDYTTKTQLKKFEDQIVSVHDVKFSPDGRQLATAAWDKTILLRNTNDWAIQHKLEEHINIVNTIDYSPDGSVLVSGAGNNAVAEADNSVICWNSSTGESICQFKDHRGEILKVICDPTNNRFFSASVDGAVKYSDYKTCELIATYQATGGTEFMIYTPDNYYMASKKALNGIGFRIGNKLVPFDQFYMHLDRPDIVAQRIGKSTGQLIKLYHYLYKKRLKKLNLEEGDLKLDFNLPQLSIETKFDIVTTNASQKLWVLAADPDYNLKRINVYVNNVPIYGENGFEIEGNIKSIRKELEIPLITGKNKIQISCMNSNGVESLYERFEIIRNSDPQKHDLYIVAIGVSDYKDDRFKLKYPTKDARDILNKFNESKEMYKNIHSKLLINSDVTKENMIALDSFFSSCTYEDLAVVFIAGHGVLNVNYDYFFGTYDMDFDNPDLRGLPYDEISTLLNKIKAYRKLLVMDTCHSGELDKDEVEAGEPDVEEGDVQFRSGGAGVRKKEGLGFENTIKYTEGLFTDIRKGSGATVISSAGGAEYAIESDEWQNGLFTYVFLQGLSNKANREVYLSEIKKYVNQQVKILSNGKQIPSAREENINSDYIIFEN